MPVRSLRSSVLRWPSRESVTAALVEWSSQYRNDPRIVRLGYFGSCARGDWGVGSDVDIVVVSDDPRLSLATEALPVPADVLRLSTGRYETLLHADSRFARVLRDETVWLAERPGFA